MSKKAVLKKQKKKQLLEEQKKRTSAQSSSASASQVSSPNEETAISTEIKNGLGPDKNCKHFEATAQKLAFSKSFITQFDKRSSWECSSCAVSSHKKGKKKPSKKKKSELWICFTCGMSMCSDDVRHHFDTSLTHHFAIQMESCKIKCWTCERDVRVPESEIADYPGILQALDLFKNNKANNFSSSSSSSSSNPGPSSSSTKGPSVSGSISGIKGLQNLGNTCFFNSAVQNLLHVTRLRDYFLQIVRSMQHQPENSEESVVSSVILGESPLVAAFRELMCAVWDHKSGKTILNPNSLHKEICKKAARFRGGDQQDSHELLIELLDRMDIDEKKCVASGKSFVQQTFGGSIQSRVVCLCCQTVYKVQDPTLTLEVALPNTFSSSAMSSSSGYSAVNSKKSKKQKKRKGKYDDFFYVSEPSPPTPKQSAKSGGSSGPARIKPDLSSPDAQMYIKRVTQDFGISIEEASSLWEQCLAPSMPLESEFYAEKKKQVEPLFDFRGPSEPRNSNAAVSSSSLNLVQLLTEYTAPEMVANFNCVACTRAALLKQEQTLQTKAEVRALLRQEGLSEDIKFETLTQQQSSNQNSTQDSTQDPNKNGLASSGSCDAKREISPAEETRIESEEEEEEDEVEAEEGGSKRVRLIKTSCLKQVLIHNLPNTLVIQLKRFYQTGYGFQKLGTAVKFPLAFDVGVFTTSQKSASYSLTGIVEHSGSISGGHYTCYVKNLALSETATAQWFYISDSYSRPASETEVLTSEAYLLFYERDESTPIRIQPRKEPDAEPSKKSKVVAPSNQTKSKPQNVVNDEISDPNNNNKDTNTPNLEINKENGVPNHEKMHLDEPKIRGQEKTNSVSQNEAIPEKGTEENKAGPEGLPSDETDVWECFQ